MVYFWSQALISARVLASEFEPPPFGFVFANFMTALTLGSLSFGYITSDGNSVQLSSRAIQAALSISASSLLFVVLVQDEMLRFWAFCIFEYCLGLYTPSMGFLKSKSVRDTHRGRTYGLMRMPLNIFVVAALASVQEGTYA